MIIRKIDGNIENILRPKKKEITILLYVEEIKIQFVKHF